MGTLATTGPLATARAQPAEPAPEPARPGQPDPAPPAAPTTAEPPAARPELAQPSPRPPGDLAGEVPGELAPARAAPPAPPARDQRASREPKQRDVDVTGRAFIRDTIVTEGGTHELAVDSARLGARYEDREHDLRVEVEVELARRTPEVRDAYIRLDATPWLRVKVGNFKRPISAVALESRWDLPVLERGLANDVELQNEFTDEPDELPLGRAEGVELTLRARDAFGDPRLRVGVFRSAANEQIADSALDRTPPSLADGFPEDVFARAEIEPVRDVTVAVSGGWIAILDRAGDRDTLGHGLIGGVDVTAFVGPLRLWAEVYTGASPFHLGVAVEAGGRFTAARAIAAYRHRVAAGPLRYVEPNAMVQILDLSTDADGDRAHQAAGGINLGFGKAWRLWLAAEYTSDIQFVGGRTAFAAQLGAVLR